VLTTARSRRPFRQSLLQLLSELSLCLFCLLLLLSSLLLLGVVAAQSVAVLVCVAVRDESMPLLMSSQSLVATDCR
jgi:sorbitol-specific phosphotransferase system component IIBC